MNLRDFQLRWVATAAAAAALAVPAAAQAKQDPGGATSPAGPSAVQAPVGGAAALNDGIHSPATASAAASHPDSAATRVVPDVRGSSGGAAAHPDSRAGIRGPNRAAFVATASASSSFDWGDAGVGAGTALALMLAAAGSAFLVRQRRTKLAL